jgi:reactive intermediate/imine deaminase
MKLIAAVAIAVAMTSSAGAAALQAPAPAPPPFSKALRVGDVIYLSGQIGIGPDGKLPDGIEAQTRQALNNIGAVLKQSGVGYGNIFHCTAMLADMKLWPAFNKTYLEFFPEPPLPTRSAFGANGLALGALVEIECQAYAKGK